jgi:hypothetical protein
VDAWRVRDVAKELAVAGIDDDDVSGARDEEAMGGGIDFEIVPATGAAEFDFFEEVITGRVGGLRGRSSQRYVCGWVRGQERREEEQGGEGHKKSHDFGGHRNTSKGISED